MRSAAGRMQAEAIGVKLCRWTRELVYELSLLRPRTATSIHVFIDAKTRVNPLVQRIQIEWRRVWEIAEFRSRGWQFFGRRGGNVALETLLLKRGRSVRLLVVEDDKDLNVRSSRALAQAGYAVDHRLRWRRRVVSG